jgi:predicted amidohydrolase YtcJ
MLEHGIETRFGSDAPVEDPNPFLGIYAAVTRQRLDGSPLPDGWYPEQRLAQEDAIVAYINPLGNTQLISPLSAGNQADLIVLEADPFSMPARELADMKPLMTIVGGEIVYQR